MLVFVVIPFAVIAVVTSLVFAGSDRTRRVPRYRPGRPYEFRSIWFLASPEQVQSAPAGRPGQGSPPAIEGPVLEDVSGARVRPGPTGGASDSW